MTKTIRVTLLVPMRLVELRGFVECLKFQTDTDARRIGQLIPYRFWNPVLINCQYGLG